MIFAEQIYQNWNDIMNLALTNTSSEIQITQFNQEISIKNTLVTSLNILVMKRILDTIQKEGRINRTNLAGKAGLNYLSCSRYINTLVLFGWIRILPNYNYVVITEKGMGMRRTLEILN
jgi:predicted transcriptional regulator